jgi:osmotically-inducible protein OsmY
MHQQEHAVSEIVIAYPSFLSEEQPVEEVNSVAVVAAARLRQAPYLELRHVNCYFHCNILSLQGQVSSYYLRQMAQALIQGLEGVEAIDNQLEVIPGRLPKNRRL